MIECPKCRTTMTDDALFCPGCAMPRTHLRERLEQQAAMTGIRYEQLLAEARLEDMRRRAAGSPTSGSFATPPPQFVPETLPIPETKGKGKLYIISGAFMALVLTCAACVVFSTMTWKRAGISTEASDAGEAVRYALTLDAEGRVNERWDMLHPVHQQAVPLRQFQQCGSWYAVDNANIILEHNETVNIPLVGETDARAVNFVWSRDDEADTGTVYMVEVEDEWRWFLSLDELAAFRSGTCP